MMKRLFFLFTGITLFICSCTKEFSNPPSPGRMIKQFKLETGQYGTETFAMQNDQYKINILVAKDVNLTALTPQITISDGATVSPKSGEKINISTNKSIDYTVTAADGKVRVWKVDFKIIDSNIEDYGAYIITSVANNQYLGIQGDTLYNEKYKDATLLEISGFGSSAGTAKHQKWHTIYKITENGIKYYQIRNLFSGKLLTVPVSSTAPNIELGQSQILKGKADDQLWSIEETIEPGVYQIINKGNGMALSNENIIYPNGKTKALQQPLNSTSIGQKWKLTPISPESYRDDEVVNFFKRITGSVAFDQGTSVPLADGRVIWITQDAFYQGSLTSNGRLFGNHFISYGNSLIMQPTVSDWSPSAPMVTAVGARSNIGNVFPVQPGLTWSWPGVGVQIGDKVYVQCGEGNGLTAVNQSLYELTPNGGTQWTFKRTMPAGMSNQVAIGYSSGMVKAADGYVYSYGSSSPPGSFGYSTYLHVARFPVTDPQSWAFWNGSTWVNTPTTNANSKIDDGLATNSVSYVNGKYIHLSMDQGYNCGDNSRNIYISTSSSPTGPFTNRKMVHHITEYLKGYNARFYTPAIHSESVNGRNELLITYSLNFGSCPQNSDNNSKESDGNYDPYYYQVKGIRIPYSVIGL